MLDKIKNIADKSKQYQDKLTNEEITKTALILPFISALEYDITNPFEVVPEFHADYPELKADKVDLCIMINDQPTIMVECKKYEAELDKQHKRQLAKYFHWVKTVRIAILTNGRDFEFYSDLKAPNVMDEQPFFKFQIDNVSDSDVKILEQFSKTNFDIDTVLNQASKSSATGVILEYIKENFELPGDEYVSFILKQVIDKLPSGSQVVNQKVKDTFKPAIIEAHQKLINNIISDRLQAVIKHEPKSDLPLTTTEKTEEIVTTQEEIDGFNVVKAICASVIDPDLIFLRDAQSYCAILLNDNNRKPIVRLHFNSKSTKYIEIFEDKNSPKKIQISKSNEIYKYSEEIKNAVKQYNE